MDSEQKKLYRKRLKKTTKILGKYHSKLFTEIVNIAFLNEYKELGKVFEAGDSYQFQIEHFENSTDENIRLLLDLYKKIHRTTATFKNINLLK